MILQPYYSLGLRKSVSLTGLSIIIVLTKLIYQALGVLPKSGLLDGIRVLPRAWTVMSLGFPMDERDTLIRDLDFELDELVSDWQSGDEGEGEARAAAMVVLMGGVVGGSGRLDGCCVDKDGVGWWYGGEEVAAGEVVMEIWCRVVVAATDG
ncbi:hypothetical protein Tco_1053703 [Tanacetum coccineum]|uniref:Uncharacterized protein n=1 Tax=Tanacetum coccineum TaxID=301880 RepID=A0ABQ5GVX5_9ASTR